MLEGAKMKHLLALAPSFLLLMTLSSSAQAASQPPESIPKTLTLLNATQPSWIDAITTSSCPSAGLKSAA
jgi:hypothetical protein